MEQLNKLNDRQKDILKDFLNLMKSLGALKANEFDPQGVASILEFIKDEGNITIDDNPEYEKDLEVIIQTLRNTK